MTFIISFGLEALLNRRGCALSEWHILVKKSVDVNPKIAKL